MFDEQENAPLADSSSHLLSLCRSSSTSGESWWTRSRQPRTLGSARLWAPWRALPPLPPAPRPRPRPLQRRVLPRPSVFMSPAGCTLEPRNTSWRNKQQRNAVFLFFLKAGGKAELTRRPGLQTTEKMREETGGGTGPATCGLLEVYVWVKSKVTVELLCFTGDGIWFKAHRSMLILFCWVRSPNSLEEGWVNHNGIPPVDE